MIVIIVYHKNVYDIYKHEWIAQFYDSIVGQTRKDFTLYELNYGGGEERLFSQSVYESLQLPTFIDAMNYLIDKAFSDGATIVFNSNCDDYFDLSRIEKQVPFIENGYDIVSSNFCLVQDDKITHTHKFDTLNIKTELDRNHNIVCHPSVAYSAAFWKGNRYVPTQCPLEDLLLWKRAINNGYNFVILPDVLCYHRVHENSVCNSNNR